jgi:hypothetical protein
MTRGIFTKFIVRLVRLQHQPTTQVSVGKAGVTDARVTDTAFELSG